MKAVVGLIWRRRSLTAMILALVAAMTFMVAGAFADAGNPVLGTIKATAVDNGSTVTITVKGQWNWQSHGSDCNTDRAATGAAVLWTDPTEDGYNVGGSGNFVGVAAKHNTPAGARWPGGSANDPNPLDRMVHPADRGNLAVSPTLAGPAGQTFNDPTSNNPSEFSVWRGGCGRAPFTTTGIVVTAASQSGNTVTLTLASALVGVSVGDPTMQVFSMFNMGYNSPTAAGVDKNAVKVTAVSGGGTQISYNAATSGLPSCSTAATCKGKVNLEPWGSWGYEPNANTHSFSHTYTKVMDNGQSGLPSRVCVNFYDVHDSGGQVPSGASNITVDGNSDNSIQTNDFDVTDGANCITVAFPTVSTDIHNDSHTVVTTIEAGGTTKVHDFVTVTGPTSGNLNVDWFLNGTCSGTRESNSGNVALDATGHKDVTTFEKGPLAVGLYSFKAHYLGDGVHYLAADGPCEPLRVVDAKISITPSATNRVGDPHVFTGHVEVNDGSGWVNAPQGTSINFSNPGVGSWSINQCTTSLATGSCTVTLTSTATGVSTVTASTSVLVSTLSLTRSTDGNAPNSGPATKTWVNARISIAPSAANRVGQAHTFTVTVEKDLGTQAGFEAAAGEHVAFTLTDANGAVSLLDPLASTCDDAGNNTDGNGQCLIVFSSSSTGKVTGHASASLTLGTVNPTTFSVATGSGGLNSPDAVKTYVNARISIAPSAANRVGQAHTFTVTVEKDLGTQAGFEAAAGEHVAFTLTDTNGAVSLLDAVNSTCDNAGANTDVNGQCTLVFQSSSTGKVTGHASASLTLGTVNPTTFSVATGSGGLNSPDAVKTYVNARISIAPSAANRVGQAHTFTVTLEKDLGTQAGFEAAAGEHVAFTLTDTNGAVSLLDAVNSTCDNAGANTDVNGQCTLVFQSSSTGKVTGHASASLTLGTVNPTTFSVATGSGGLNSPDAVKTYVNARISIAPSAANRVGQAHTFTVTVEKDLGTQAGFEAAAGEHVAFTLTDTNGAVSLLDAVNSTCDNAGANTDLNGQCTLVFQSSSTGKVTGHASASLTLGTVNPTTFSVATGSGGLNSPDAVKTYVNARISIAPSAANRVGQAHTFTVTVEKDLGTQAGFEAAAGEHVAFTLTDANGAVSLLDPLASTCDDAGNNTDGNGQCLIVFSSSSTGKVTGHASASLTLGTVNPTTFSVATGTGGLNSPDAVKTYVNARISIAPSAANRVGQPHTFTVTVEKDLGTQAGFQPAAAEHVDYTLTDANGALSLLDPLASTCDDAGNNTDGNGQCLIVFSSSSTGKVTGHASASLTLGTVNPTTFSVATGTGGLNSPDAVKTYVNARISIAPSAANRVGQAHTFTVTVEKDLGTQAGFEAAAGEHVAFTLTDTNGAVSLLDAVNSTCDNAGANTDLNGQCTLVFQSSSTGKVTGHASASLTLGTVNPTTFSVATGSGGLNSPDAAKTYVNARISIAPSAANRVGQAHTFTVTVEKDLGTQAGFEAAAGEHVAFTLTDANGALSLLDPLASTCDDAGNNTDGNGQCLIVFSSSSTGKVTGHASASLTLGTVNPTTFSVATGTGGLNSPDAVKTYVNARISIAPSAANRVGQPHTFTVTVEKDLGTQAGFEAAAGEHVAFTLTDANGAVSLLDPLASTCDDAGNNTDGNGQCLIVFSSSSTGKVTGHASASLTLGTVNPTTFSVATGTGGLNSPDAVKTYVNARISIAPSAANRVGQPHTFTVTVEKDLGTQAGFQPAAAEHVDYTLTDANGALSLLDAVNSTCDNAGANTDLNGQCTLVFQSSSTGKVTGHASASLTLGTVNPTTFSVATGTGGLNSPDAVKTYVNAKIEIATSATNAVGDPHTFTVTLSKDTGTAAGFEPAAGEHVDYLLTDTNGAVSVLDAANSTCDNAGNNTDSNGQCLIVFKSNTAGKVTAHASASLTLGTVNPTTFSVATGTGGLNSPDAVKTYVDANIQISPQSATNPLSTDHTLTGHVNVNTGSGAFGDAPAGTLITFSLTNAGGATASFVGPNTCTTVGVTGSCDVVIKSSTAGTTTVKASTDVTVGTVSLHRETGDGKVGDSVNATKKWAAARISITPDATNEIGQPHTFIVTLEKDPGTGTYVAADGEHVDVTLSDSNGAGYVLDAPNSTCDNAGPNTDTNGQCTITFASPTAGKVTGHASASLDIGGATVNAQTNGAGGSTGDAVKTFVDANIQIAQDGVNRVGQTHTFTAHVNKNPGTGLVNAAGVTVTFNKDSGPGTLSAPSCTTNAGGDCTVDLDSSVTGVTKVSAHTTFTLGGVSLTRDTDTTHGSSGPATKRWVNAKIALSPDATNEVGDPHTFTVTLSKDTGTGTYVAAPGEHVDFTLPGAVVDAASSTCDNAGQNTDANGQCTIAFTSPTAGQFTAHATSTLSVAGSANFTVATDGKGDNGSDAVKTFVDAKIRIADDGVNRVGQKHTFTAHVDKNPGTGFANAAGVLVTFNKDSGPGTLSAPSCTTNAGGDCTVDLDSSVTGVTKVSAHTTFLLGGVSLTRDTDATHGSSGPATKRWVDAKITVEPNATHEVGQPHTFTVTLWKDLGDGSGFVKAANEDVNYTLTDSNAANSVLNAAASSCDDTGANTNVGGLCTLVLTSNTPGKTTARASSTLAVAGSAPFTVATDGNAPNSGNAVATFVDANIGITPAQATNPLNTDHVLTGHVNVNDGLGGGFANAPAGTTIDFALISGPGSFVGGVNSCTTVAATGSCTVTITSSTTGVTKIRAKTDVPVGGVTLHRQSGDGKAGDSTDAAKLWASAKIDIAPDATHEVGQAHTFTVTLLKDTSNGAFAPAQGETVKIELDNGNGAIADPAGPFTCTTDANGQCSVTITSSTTGTVAARASATLSVNGTTISVATNGIAPNSGSAVATFVDANVQITPATAINPIGTTHTLTGHVNVNAGAGVFANAPSGTTINFALTGPASFAGPSSCTTVGVTGSCTIVISSTTVGTSTIKASTDVSVGGVTLHRESADGKAGDGADATKLWADATARTDILNASGNVVTSVVAGTIVHDKVFVATAAGTPAGVPNPTGTVIFHRFATIDCTGTPVTNQTVALTAGSPSTAITDDFAPVSDMSFRADYLGDANYPARSGACEPLTVTPVAAPSIVIVKNPKAQTVAVGGTATFTITVTNAGNTVLTDVTVSDPLTPSCNRTKAEIPALASMAPGASVTYSCTKTNVRASFDNVATAIGTPPSGPNVTASDTAPVKAAPLTPAKKKVVKKKKKPKVVSHKKPKATG